MLNDGMLPPTEQGDGWDLLFRRQKEDYGGFRSRYTDSFRWALNADQYSIITGRGTREEEAAQGPRHEASQVHPPFRQRYHDRWQAEGTLNSIRDNNPGCSWDGMKLGRYSGIVRMSQRAPDRLRDLSTLAVSSSFDHSTEQIRSLMIRQGTRN